MALCLTQVFNKDRTFRPRKRFEPGTQRFELYKKAQASLKSGLDLRSVVQLPPGENINDWIAVHVVDFFNRINLIYGTMSEFCTERSCPIMSGGLRYEYRWQDELKFKKPTKVSAPLYMNLLMDWIETMINNEDIFPTRTGIPFPKNFQQVCTKIVTRLFRVFVHVYIHHFDGIISVGAEAHVNTCYKHFYYFITEFSLVDHRELEPLVRNSGRHTGIYEAVSMRMIAPTLSAGLMVISPSRTSSCKATISALFKLGRRIPVVLEAFNVLISLFTALLSPSYRAQAATTSVTESGNTGYKELYLKIPCADEVQISQCLWE
ncbi:MOB kinase activator 3C-like [Leptodactylus fuscus]|uniref:MOB kinase activator 3C n=1 Tax=Leptodactylus fuscus TaxID=238119 RepID=UPI003F4F2E2C